MFFVLDLTSSRHLRPLVERNRNHKVTVKLLCQTRLPLLSLLRLQSLTKRPGGETQSGRWCESKDVTGSRDPAEARVAFIEQVCADCQAEKRAESERPRLSEI